MENRHVKVIMSGIIVVFFLTFILGSVRIGHSEAPEVVEGHEVNDATETKDNVDLPKEDNDSGMAETSETVLENMTKKEKRMAELTDKYNDSFYGQVAYYLEVLQKYSLPICFVGITVGSFNFLIVGNKKLDKKEQGFGWIVGFTIGLVVFNVLPLIFALFVAGR